MLLAGLLVALAVSLVHAQPPDCLQSNLGCTEFTASCQTGRCACKPEFYGVRCELNFDETRPDLFYALDSVHMVLALMGAAFGSFLFLYYFCRFVRRAKTQNQQIVSITLVTMAAYFRFFASVIYLSLGPGTVRTYFYKTPNGTQFMLRFFSSLYYPLVMGALTLQVLIWMEFVMAVKSLRPSAHSMVPRLKWVFFPALIFLVVFVIIIQALLVTNTNAFAVLLVYRLVLGLYILVLLIFAVVSAVRLLLILKNSHRVHSEGSLTSRARNSRKNLTRMVLVSCIFTALGLILSIMYLAMPVDTDSNYYWPFIFVLRLVEMFLVLSLLVTALAMMRNRIAYTASSSTRETESDSSVHEVRDSVTEGGSESSGPMLGQNFKRASVMRGSRTSANKELAEPLMDYSGFGSTLDDEDTITRKASLKMAALSAGGVSLLDEDKPHDGYRYEPNELVWAQYRMDGLWYAARVEGLEKSGELRIEYLDYQLTDTMSPGAVCADHSALLTGERLNQIKAFDSRPTEEMLASSGAPQPDTFGLVRLRGSSAKKPNHSSLLLKRAGEMANSGSQF